LALLNVGSPCKDCPPAIYLHGVRRDVDVFGAKIDLLNHII
jgi:hypothetical protein